MERQRDGEIERSGFDDWKFEMVEEEGFINVDRKTGYT
jgi:hypothetical protein